MAPGLVGICLAGDADHQSEIPVDSRFNARDRILDDDCPCRRDERITHVVGEGAGHQQDIGVAWLALSLGALREG